MVMPRTYAPRRGGWVPPQKALLVGAWVRGLSGNVGKLGVWPGQYGAAQGLTLAADAVVDADGLTVDGAGDMGTAVGLGQRDAAWSLSFWIRQPVVQSPPAPVVLHGGIATGMWLGFVISGRFIRWTTGDSFGTHFTAFIPDAGWHLVTVTNDNLPPLYAGSGCRLYLDGGPVGAYPCQHIVPDGRPFVVGGGQLGAPWYYFRGNLDCLYYWQGAALAAAEVVQLWAGDPHRRGNLP